MRHRTTRRLVTVFSVSAACTVLAARPDDGTTRAGATVPPPTVSQAVSAALRIADGAGVATVDESVACMGPAPQALAYTTNRIVLRSSGTAGDVARLLRRALKDIKVRATVGPPHEITLPRKQHDAGVTPVWWSDLTPTSSETPVPVVDLARDLINERGTPGAPDYLLSPSGGPVGMWPYGSPTTPPGPIPDPRPNDPGDGIVIAVYDTGVPAANNNPPANLDQFSSYDTEDLDVLAPAGVVDLYYGDHLTAMAGVLDVIAPGATVTALRMTQPNGVATDVSAARRMATTLKAANRHDAWPDVIVNAFGSPTCTLDPTSPGTDLVPLGLEAVDEAVDRIGESLVVASAGNRSTSQKFYPAAFDSVVAVGALDTTVDGDGDPLTSQSRTGPRASFSNYGSWVDVWAPGVDLITNHVDGLKFDRPGPTLHGSALVSGTSFSAPYVAGLIAEQMKTGGTDALTARDALVASGAHCTARSGRGRAVSLVDFDAAALDPARVARAPGDC